MSTSTFHYQLSVEPVSSSAFRTQLEALIANEAELSTAKAVQNAESAIEWLKTTTDPIRYLNFPGKPTPKLDYAALLEAMLQSSNLTESQRYTACNIWLCYLEGTTEDEKIHNLTALGLMWLAYFLYPFKSVGNSAWVYRDAVSGATTPTLAKTPNQFTTGLPEGRLDESSFTDFLLERDGYRCVATGRWSSNQPDKVIELIRVKGDKVTSLPLRTEGAHIFQRAIYLASISTWDIVRHYGSFPDKMVNRLDEMIDRPENGITLSLESHHKFDNFNWCLIPKEGNDDRVWGTKEFSKFFEYESFSTRPTDLLEEVVFRDVSVTAPTQGKRAQCGIPLPNSKFIRLHSAICHVLHLSGAGEVLDEYINRYEKEDPGVPSGDTFLTWLSLAPIEVAESPNCELID